VRVSETLAESVLEYVEREREEQATHLSASLAVAEQHRVRVVLAQVLLANDGEAVQVGWDAGTSLWRGGGSGQCLCCLTTPQKEESHL